MSSYHKGAIFTVELGSLVENGFDLGMREYPIFDEQYREPLNNKIIEHFWFREIGLETPQLFKRFLNRRLNEIMPFYNQLYKSCLLEYDPLSNYSLTSVTSHTSQNEVERTAAHVDTSNTSGETKTTNDSDSHARNLVSTTPQMQLSGREDYASNITESDSTAKTGNLTEQDATTKTDATDTSKDSANARDDGTSKVTGLSGVLAADALERYRSTLLNIDMMVIEELQDLFMGLYTDYFNAL